MQGVRRLSKKWTRPKYRTPSNLYFYASHTHEHDLFAVGSTSGSSLWQELGSSLIRESLYPRKSYWCLETESGDFSHDLFAINIAAVMLGYVYGHSKQFGMSPATRPHPTSLSIDQKLSANQDLVVKVASPVGTVFGQLLFGWLADVFGRKRMCMSNHDYDLSIISSEAHAPVPRRHRDDAHHRRNLWASLGGTGARREHHRSARGMAIPPRGRNRRGLPLVFCHPLRIRVHQDTRSHDGRCWSEPGMGSTRYVELVVTFFVGHSSHVIRSCGSDLVCHRFCV